MAHGLYNGVYNPWVLPGLEESPRENVEIIPAPGLVVLTIPPAYAMSGQCAGHSSVTLSHYSLSSQTS